MIKIKFIKIKTLILWLKYYLLKNKIKNSIAKIKEKQIFFFLDNEL
jgi:hypothetical protein